MIKYPTEPRNVNESFIVTERVHIDMLNKALGDIELTKEEERSLIWLCGWETSTIKHIISAFNKAEKSRPRSFDQLSTDEQIQYWEQRAREQECEDEKWK